MTLRNLTLSAVLALGLVGCDQSKAELDQAKTQITSLTAERDGLKGQLDQANAKVTALQQQVTDLQGKLTAAATPPPAEEAAKPAAGKPAAKKPASRVLTKEQKTDLETHPEVKSGKNRF
jgi:cell division protein FtsB